VGNKIIFAPLASKELDEAYDWYEERSLGLGDNFLDVLDKAFELISANPLVAPLTKQKYRDKVIDGFPYIVVYEFKKSEDAIYIIHIFHTSRNPKLKYKQK